MTLIEGRGAAFRSTRASIPSVSFAILYSSLVNSIVEKDSQQYKCTIQRVIHLEIYGSTQQMFLFHSM